MFFSIEIIFGSTWSRNFIPQDDGLNDMNIILSFQTRLARKIEIVNFTALVRKIRNRKNS